MTYISFLQDVARAGEAGLEVKREDFGGVAFTHVRVALGCKHATATVAGDRIITIITPEGREAGRTNG